MSRARLCYHRRRHAHLEYAGTSAWTIVKCRDCGAEVSAAYGAPLPELVPLPVVDGTVEVGKVASS